jgi:hypothetical protein
MFDSNLGERTPGPKDMKQSGQSAGPHPMPLPRIESQFPDDPVRRLVTILTVTQLL